MRSLTANDAIRIWESGYGQWPGERAVSVLAAAYPEASRVELRRLTLGQCNIRLLEVRDRTFGPEAGAFSECTTCGERLEFTLNTKALRQANPDAALGPELILESDDYTLRFRPLEIEDLNAAAATGDVESGRRCLVERCILEARCSARTLTVAELPESVIADLGQRLSQSDSGAEVLVELLCPACESRYELPFDMASFFYTEISAQAQRLLREVDVLARAYGWSEETILEMSARRRQFYLEILDR